MKVYFYNTTIINLADVSYINTFNNGGRKTIQIHFYMKSNKEFVSITVPTDEVKSILTECYTIMKEKG